MTGLYGRAYGVTVAQAFQAEQARQAKESPDSRSPTERGRDYQVVSEADRIGAVYSAFRSLTAFERSALDSLAKRYTATVSALPLLVELAKNPAYNARYFLFVTAATPPSTREEIVRFLGAAWRAAHGLPPLGTSTEQPPVDDGPLVSPLVLGLGILAVGVGGYFLLRGR